jgi:hypothetical protein
VPLDRSWLPLSENQIVTAKKTNRSARRCIWRYRFIAEVWNCQILNQVVESQLSTSLWNRYHRWLSDIELIQISAFSASYSWIIPCFAAGKRIYVRNCHATCGHWKTNHLHIYSPSEVQYCILMPRFLRFVSSLPNICIFAKRGPSWVILLLFQASYPAIWLITSENNLIASVGWVFFFFFFGSSHAERTLTSLERLICVCVFWLSQFLEMRSCLFCLFSVSEENTKPSRRLSPSCWLSHTSHTKSHASFSFLDSFATFARVSDVSFVCDLTYWQWGKQVKITTHFTSEFCNSELKSNVPPLTCDTPRSTCYTCLTLLLRPFWKSKVSGKVRLGLHKWELTTWTSGFLQWSGFSIYLGANRYARPFNRLVVNKNGKELGFSKKVQEMGQKNRRFLLLAVVRTGFTRGNGPVAWWTLGLQL